MTQRTFICRGPQCWGRGDTPRAALLSAKRHLSRTTNPPPGRACFIINSCPPDTEVNDLGGLTYMKCALKPGEANYQLFREPWTVGYYDINGRVPMEL